MRFLAWMALLCGVISHGVPHGSAADGIAAIVNDEAVTLGEVEQRMTLFIKSLDLEDSKALRDDIRPRVLENLILEILKKQEAVRAAVDITPQQISDALRHLERLNNVPEGQFEDYMDKQGYDRAAWFGQLEAQLYWDNYVSSFLRPEVRVSDGEIADFLQSYQSREKRDEYLISEIFLPIIDEDDKATSMDTAFRVYGVLSASRNLANEFSLLARQYSQSASAAAGGNIGWVSLDDIAQELRDAVQKTSIGHIQGPLIVSGGVYILYVRDRRLFAEENSLGVALRQVSIDKGREDARTHIEAAQRIAKQPGRACPIDDAYDAIDDIRVLDLGKMGIEDLSALFKNAIEVLPERGVTDILETYDSYAFLKLCKRETRQVALPSRDVAHERIFYRRLERLVQKRIRDLWRSSYVERRL